MVSWHHAHRLVLWVVLLAAPVGASDCGDRGRTFDGERAYQHLLAQVDMGPRIPGSDGHRRTLEYLRSHLEAMAEEVVVHRFEEPSPLDSSLVTYESLVAVFRRASPVRILFAAHWDTRPRADKDPDPQRRGLPVPGANDGASGTAVLLEIASALHRSPPCIGVDLVLFDGEDSGTYGDPESFARGSRRFVADHPDYRPAFAVIVDMVGRRGTRIPKEGNSLLGAGSVVERIWMLGRKLGLEVLADTLGEAVFDDHIAFLRAGIPAVDLIDRADPAWHTTRDLPENCAPESLEQVGRLLLALVATAEESLSP